MPFISRDKLQKLTAERAKYMDLARDHLAMSEKAAENLIELVKEVNEHKEETTKERGKLLRQINDAREAGRAYRDRYHKHRDEARDLKEFNTELLKMVEDLQKQIADTKTAEEFYTHADAKLAEAKRLTQEPDPTITHDIWRDALGALGNTGA